VELAARLLDQMQDGAPQVMMDVKVYEVTRTALRTFGLDLPLQFQMFNLTPGVIAAALGAGGQNLINQLFSSGAINQANSQAIQALIAQLQNQQNSIFNTPFATFGGGLTRFAVGVPPATARVTRS
jgi:general secretion pathway protein D